MVIKVLVDYLRQLLVFGSVSGATWKRPCVKAWIGTLSGLTAQAAAFNPLCAVPDLSMQARKPFLAEQLPSLIAPLEATMMAGVSERLAA